MARQGSSRAVAPSFNGPQQISEQVAAYVRDQVMAGQLRSGTFIRPEHVATELGVSATPVREALMSLVGDGTVQWQPRRGFQIAALTREDVADLFSVQAFIAGELTARATVSLSESEIERLIEIQHQLEAAGASGDVELVGKLNHAIHRTINASSASTRLMLLLNLTVQYVPRRYFAWVKGWADASVHDHSEIFAALRDRDSGRARGAMSAHITHIGELLVDHLESVGTFDDDQDEMTT